MRSVKVEVSTFDGCLNPKFFLELLSVMDQYFDWYDLLDARRVDSSLTVLEHSRATACIEARGAYWRLA